MGITDLVSKVLSKYTGKLEELEERDADVVNSKQMYREFAELPHNQESILEDVLLPDEEWQMTVTLSGTVNAPYLTVTDQRLIKTKNSPMGYDSESYDLGSISQFDYSEGMTKTSISVSGSGGLDEEFKVSKLTSNNMDEFQQAVYKHK